MPKVNKLISCRKCSRCRHDRQKCLPEGRTWPGQRCERCQRYNYKCSGNRTKAEETLITQTAREAPATLESDPDISNAIPYGTWPLPSVGETPVIELSDTTSSSLGASSPEQDLRGMNVPVDDSKSTVQCLQECEDVYELVMFFHELESDMHLSHMVTDFIGVVSDDDDDFDGAIPKKMASDRCKMAIAVLTNRAIKCKAEGLSHDAENIRRTLLFDPKIRLHFDFYDDSFLESSPRAADVSDQRIIASKLAEEGKALLAARIEEDVLRNIGNARDALDISLEGMLNELLNSYSMFVDRIRDIWKDESGTWWPVAIYAILRHVIKIDSIELSRGAISEYLPKLSKVIRHQVPRIWTYFLAARYDASNTVVWLLEEANVNVHCIDDFPRRTALHVAAKHRSTAVAQILIDRGVDPEIKDENGFTALQLACSVENNAPMVALLLYAGSNVNTSDLDDDRPLFAALRDDNFETAIILLSYDADVNIENEHNESAIVLALRKKSASAMRWVRLLLKHKPNLDIIAMPEATARSLQGALSASGGEVLRLMLASMRPSEANSIARSQVSGQSFLAKSLVKRKTVDEAEEVIRILQRHGSDIDGQDKYGDTAYHWAVRLRNEICIGALIRAGARTDLQNINAQTPYALAMTTDESLAAYIENAVIETKDEGQLRLLRSQKELYLAFVSKRRTPRYNFLFDDFS